MVQGLVQPRPVLARPTFVPELFQRIPSHATYSPHSALSSSWSCRHHYSLLPSFAPTPPTVLVLHLYKWRLVVACARQQLSQLDSTLLEDSGDPYAFVALLLREGLPDLKPQPRHAPHPQPPQNHALPNTALTSTIAAASNAAATPAGTHEAVPDPNVSPQLQPRYAWVPYRGSLYLPLWLPGDHNEWWRLRRVPASTSQSNRSHPPPPETTSANITETATETVTITNVKGETSRTETTAGLQQVEAEGKADVGLATAIATITTAAAPTSPDYDPFTTTVATTHHLSQAIGSKDRAGTAAAAAVAVPTRDPSATGISTGCVTAPQTAAAQCDESETPVDDIITAMAHGSPRSGPFPLLGRQRAAVDPPHSPPPPSSSWTLGPGPRVRTRTQRVGASSPAGHQHQQHQEQHQEHEMQHEVQHEVQCQLTGQVSGAQQRGGESCSPSEATHGVPPKRSLFMLGTAIPARPPPQRTPSLGLAHPLPSQPPRQPSQTLPLPPPAGPGTALQQGCQPGQPPCNSGGLEGGSEGAEGITAPDGTALLSPPSKSQYDMHGTALPGPGTAVHGSSREVTMQPALKQQQHEQQQGEQELRWQTGLPWGQQAAGGRGEASSPPPPPPSSPKRSLFMLGTAIPPRERPAQQEAASEHQRQHHHHQQSLLPWAGSPCGPHPRPDAASHSRPDVGGPPVPDMKRRLPLGASLPLDTVPTSSPLLQPQQQQQPGQDQQRVQQGWRLGRAVVEAGGDTHRSGSHRGQTRAEMGAAVAAAEGSQVSVEVGTGNGTPQGLAPAPPSPPATQPARSLFVRGSAIPFRPRAQKQGAQNQQQGGEVEDGVPAAEPLVEPLWTPDATLHQHKQHPSLTTPTLSQDKDVSLRAEKDPEGASSTVAATAAATGPTARASLFVRGGDIPYRSPPALHPQPSSSPKLPQPQPHAPKPPQKPQQQQLLPPPPPLPPSPSPPASASSQPPLHSPGTTSNASNFTSAWQSLNQIGMMQTRPQETMAGQEADPSPSPPPHETPTPSHSAAPQAQEQHHRRRQAAAALPLPPSPPTSSSHELSVTDMVRVQEKASGGVGRVGRAGAADAKNGHSLADVSVQSPGVSYSTRVVKSAASRVPVASRRATDAVATATAAIASATDAAVASTATAAILTATDAAGAVALTSPRAKGVGSRPGRTAGRRMVWELSISCYGPGSRFSEQLIKWTHACTLPGGDLTPTAALSAAEDLMTTLPPAPPPLPPPEASATVMAAAAAAVAATRSASGVAVSPTSLSSGLHRTTLSAVSSRAPSAGQQKYLLGLVRKGRLAGLEPDVFWAICPRSGEGPSGVPLWEDDGGRGGGSVGAMVRLEKEAPSSPGLLLHHVLAVQRLEEAAEAAVEAAAAEEAAALGLPPPLTRRQRAFVRTLVKRAARGVDADAGSWLRRVFRGVVPERRLRRLVSELVGGEEDSGLSEYQMMPYRYGTEARGGRRLSARRGGGDALEELVGELSRDGATRVIERLKNEVAKQAKRGG